MKKLWIILSLLAIFILQASQVLYFILNDNSNPGWDESWHAMISLNIYDTIAGTQDIRFEQIYPIFRFANSYYPHFFHAATAFLYLFFGTSYKIALVTNIIFFAIMAISCFFIGKKLHNEVSGIFLAAIVSAIPIYSNLQKVYLIDFALCSMVSLGYMSLLYSENFRRLDYTLLFAAVSGLGMLTKWTYLVYLLVPICFEIRDYSKKHRRFIFKEYFNPTIALFVFATICLIWYSPGRISDSFNQISANIVNGSLEGDPKGFSLDNLTYYLFVIVKDFSFFFLVLFISGIVIFAFNKSTVKEKKISMPMLLNVLLIFIIFTLIGNKDPRYISPAYIFMSAFIVYTVGRDKKYKAVLMAAVIFGLALSIALNSSLINLEVRQGDLIFMSAKGIYPQVREIDIIGIMDAMNDTKQSQEFSVCIISESKELNDANLPYFSMLGRYPVKYMAGNGCDPLDADFVILGKIEETWRSSQFRNSASRLYSNLDQFEKIDFHQEHVRIYRALSNYR